MRGYRCERKAGWDTHGLPVEVEVCKELGIHSKEEIEAYGVEPFIHKCQESVWRYMQEWERLTERLGFWIHLDEAYVTYHQSYVESVWWSLKNLFDRGLLYQGHKIVWWWAQGGTALSCRRSRPGLSRSRRSQRLRPVSAGRRSRTRRLLVWTTTPWTLPSNQFAAVHPDLEYATVVDPETGERLIMAAALVETIAGKVKRELDSRIDLSRDASWSGGATCRRLTTTTSTHGETTGELDAGGSKHVAWRVVAADFVTIDSGTGVVHQAPAFGEVDYEVLIAEQERFVEGEGPELICAVGPDGKFTAEAPDYEGRWVKEADKDITRELRGRGSAVSTRSSTCTISVLLAGRRGSADPVSARELVHPHDRVQGPDAGQQPADQLAARTHPRRPLRQFPGNQRRLGAVPRTVLGNAAADLGLRPDGPDGGDRQLRRTAGQAGRAGHRSLGTGQSAPNPNCPTI